MSCKIKICGIKDPKMASFAAHAGADFIGIVQVERSARFVSLEQGCDIASAVLEAGKEPVAIFMDPTQEEVLHVCEKMRIKTVQLHGVASFELPKSFCRFERNCRSCFFDNARDFLIFDHQEGGTGKTLDWKSLTLPPGINCFLAGGLNEENIELALKIFAPFGVDVSSGVEKNGKKDQERIERFIAKVVCQRRVG